MAKLYTTCQGMRGQRTARGGRNSGVRASVQSYDGSVIVKMNLDPNNEPIIRIETSYDSTSCYGNEQFRGTIKEFEEMCQAWRNKK